MDLFYFLKVLQKRIGLLIIIPLITIIVTLIFVINKPSSFSSRATISSGVTQTQNIPDPLDREPTSQKVQNIFSNMLELMRAKPIVDLVSYDLLIHDLTNEPFRSPDGVLRNLPDERREMLVDSLTYGLENLTTVSHNSELGEEVYQLQLEFEYDYESLLNMIRAERLNSSDFIRVVTETENPELSAFISNSLTSNFIRFYQTSQRDGLGRSVEFYLQQVQLREQDLQEKVKRLQDFKTENSITNLYEQTKTIAVQISHMEELLQRERRSVLAYEILTDSLNSVLREGGGRFRESAMADMNMEIAQTRDRISEINTALWRARAEGRTQVASDLQRELDEERRRMRQSLYTLNQSAITDPRMTRQELLSSLFNIMIEKELARQSIVTILEEIDRLERITRDFARMEAIVETYNREIDLAEKEYLNMLDKLNTFRLTQEAMRTGAQMGIIERAIPPKNPMPSKKLLILLIAALGSAAFSVIAIFAIEFLDLSVRSPKELANATGRNVVGALPRLNASELDIPAIFEGNTKSEYEIAALELVRSFRNYLIKNLQGKRLLITSSQTTEGKSFLSVMLAYAFAQAGYKILLMDTNTSNNNLTLQMDASESFQGFLKGELRADEAVRSSSHPQIDVLGCTPSNQTPFEIAKIADISKTFENIERDYDLIIIDSTAMMKSNQARELLHFCTDVVSVFGAGNIIEPSAAAIFDEVDQHDVRFHGLHMNKIEREHLNDVYGEIDIERGAFRKWMKRVVSRKLS